jgi:outer membrane protein
VVQLWFVLPGFRDLFNFLEKTMKIIKKVGILASMLLMAAGVNVAMAADAGAGKVAIVNVQQVLQQSPRVTALSKKLEDQFKDRQAKLNDQQKTLQDQLDKFKKESPTMSQKDRDATEKKITTERSDLVKEVVAYQQDLQKEQNKVMQGILSDLNSVVSAIAKQSSYDLVLDAQAVVYTANGVDITKDVASKFNSKS